MSGLVSATRLGRIPRQRRESAGAGAAARDPYLYAAVLVVLLSVAFAIQHPWSGDLGMHIATIERLRDNLVHPGNPLVLADVPSPYYSPYTLALALVGKATGLSTLVVFAAAGPVVMALLLYGVRAFVRTLTARPAAPLLALVFVLLLWGKPRVWSGFFGLWSWPQTMAYPSTLALALMLIFWAALNRTLDRPPSWPRYLGLGLLLAVIALVHPFTFATAALGAAALVAVRAGALAGSTWLWLGVATAEWLALVLIWPYYPFFKLFGATGLDEIHTALYRQPWLYFGLVIVALPALWLRFRRTPRDPLVLLFVVALVLVVAGWVSGRYALGRMWPAVLLCGQLALAVEIADPPKGLARRVWVGATALACLAGVAVQSPHLVYAVPRSWVPHPLARFYGSWPDYSWITPYVRKGDVVVTDDYYAVRTVPGLGARTIPPAWPDPFLADQRLRWHELAVIHAGSTDPATRAALLAKYHAKWVIEIPGKWSISAGQTPVATGPQGQRLYRVPGS
ncbi:MAG: hypothetical protein AUI14_06720 [Actinobacteria bacterium 13_2_20CM_2_71_6]|nr:MAG: hypothetical protein AUI14_06720 [Actinobacteria bacterium 13_2_20CM_2_71_6]